MNIKDQLKESDCEVCDKALFEIIRLEAEIISLNKWLDRLSPPKASTTLRAKTAHKASQSAAGKALSQRRK